VLKGKILCVFGWIEKYETSGKIRKHIAKIQNFEEFRIHTNTKLTLYKLYSLILILIFIITEVFTRYYSNVQYNEVFSSAPVTF
jgi:hypothetical protein